MARVFNIGGLCLTFFLLAITLTPASAIYTSFSEEMNNGGGACHYEGDFRNSPYFNGGLTAYIPRSQYNGGKGCGTCYEASSQNHKSCKGGSVTVCAVGEHGGNFLLSTTAWYKIVRERAAGQVEIKYRGVVCPNNDTIAVRVMPGSNPHWFAVQILGGAEGVEKVEISKDGSSWKSLSVLGESATWVLGSGAEKIVSAGRKVSMRVTEVAWAGQQLVLQLVNVIPVKWAAGKTYAYTVIV